MPTVPTWKLYNAELVAWAAEERARIECGESRPYHAVLCDPPYGISFMGKKWDEPGGQAAFQSQAMAWGEALKPLLHPGALVFMFAGTRMWHRLAAGMEDAGFQMWDTLLWLHGQGFPKAQAMDKLIDRESLRGNLNLLELANKIKSRREEMGFSRSEIDERVFGGSTKLSWIEGCREKVYPPTPAEWQGLCLALGMKDEGIKAQLEHWWTGKKGRF